MIPTSWTPWLIAAGLLDMGFGVVVGWMLRDMVRKR